MAAKAGDKVYGCQWCDCLNKNDYSRSLKVASKGVYSVQFNCPNVPSLPYAIDLRAPGLSVEYSRTFMSDAAFRRI